MDEKTIEFDGDLVGNPLDPRKTISQFHTASFASEVYISEKCFMIVVSDPQSYQEASIEPRWKKTMQEEFNSLHENETWVLYKV